VIPLPIAQMQAHYIAQLLCGALSLPPPEQMRAEVDAFYARLESAVPSKSYRYTHRFDMPGAGFDNQFSYSNALAKECGLENVTRFEEGAWMEQLYRAAATIRRGPNAGRYRDMEDAFEDRVNALVHEAMMGEQLPSVPPERRATARERSGSPQFSQTAARVA